MRHVDRSCFISKVVVCVWLGWKMFSEGKESLAYAFSLFEKFGREPYIGEAVSQLQHAQQAAALAEKEGFGDHVVVGRVNFTPLNYLRLAWALFTTIVSMRRLPSKVPSFTTSATSWEWTAVSVR